MNYVEQGSPCLLIRFIIIGQGELLHLHNSGKGNLVNASQIYGNGN